MTIAFSKYQGTGNDFILIDGRDQIPKDLDVKLLCDRKFGIGADGLMILAPSDSADFKMIYYNSDGRLSSMCGNGGRCIAHFAVHLGLGSGNTVTFEAPDGAHRAEVREHEVVLSMNPVSNWKILDHQTIELNTGSPHFVRIIEPAPENFDLIPFAKGIRYNAPYTEIGINVNVVRIENNQSIKMRTYERGVEDETLSCGTGVTAAALSLQIVTNSPQKEVTVHTAGGTLRVQSNWTTDCFKDIYLIGPVKLVFTGIA